MQAKPKWRQAGPIFYKAFPESNFYSCPKLQYANWHGLVATVSGKQLPALTSALEMPTSLGKLVQGVGGGTEMGAGRRTNQDKEGRWYLWQQQDFIQHDLVLPTCAYYLFLIVNFCKEGGSGRKPFNLMQIWQGL